MLDAAHGEASGTLETAEQSNIGWSETQTTSIGIACCIGRRTPAVAIRADDRQVSRRVDAIARSRRMSNRLNECRSELLSGRLGYTPC